MDLLTYLIKFFTADFPKWIFRLLYRVWIRITQQLGMVAMVKAYFKPLFGFPGFLARINGVVIRTIVLAIGSISLIAITGLFAFIFLLIFLGPIYAVVKGYWLYALLGIITLILIKVYHYYFAPLKKIKDFENLRDYYDAGNIYTRSLVSKVYYAKFKDVLENLNEDKEINLFLAYAELPEKEVHDFVEKNITNLKPEIVFSKMIEINKTVKARIVTSKLIFVSILLSIPDVDTFLARYSSDSSLVIGCLNYIHRLGVLPPQIWEDDYLIPPAGGVDKGWTIGYTSNLNKYGVDFTGAALKGFGVKLIGRENVKANVINTLSKPNKNNVVLIGKPGTGKSTFVRALASEIALGTSIPALRYKRIISLNLPELISGGVAETASRISGVLREASAAGNIIIFLDEMQNLFSMDKNSDVMITALERYLGTNSFQFIGTTSRGDYNKMQASHGSFLNAFDTVEVDETPKDETIEIMTDAVCKKERGIFITYPSLESVYNLSGRFIYDRYFPDKGVQMLNQVISNAKSNRSAFIDKDFTAQTFSSKLKIPTDSLKQDDKKKLINLEEDLHKQVIGQDLGIKYISNAVKRARTNIRDENKPIASFLFFGPTGVGKTETAKALAGIYYGSQDFLVRADMSEYQTPESVHRLIGGPGYPIGTLTSQVKAKPYSLVLLDEIEKADRNIFSLFLQVLDEGRLTDSNGDVVNFSNNMIIMTSNVGTKGIIESLESGADKNESLDAGLNAVKDFFAPEFLNRFTALVPFFPLTPEQIIKIAKIKLLAIEKRMAKQKIKINFSDEVVMAVATLGYSKEWGGRPLNRVIEDRVETKIADLIIAGEIKPGDTYTMESIK